MKHRYWLVVFLILLIGTLASIKEPDYLGLPIPSPAIPDDEQADYFFDRFKLTTNNQQGQADYVLQGEYWAHYEDQSFSSITQPKLYWVDKKLAQWKINADLAEISTDKDVIQLQGNVKLKRLASPQSTQMLITSPSLELQTQKRILSSPDLVLVQTPEAQLSAEGIRVQLSSGQVDLLAKVKATYAKP